MPISEAYGIGGDEFVTWFIDKHLLQPEEAEKKLGESGVLGAYIDPQLVKNVKSDKTFLLRAADGGVIKFKTVRSIERCGISFLRNTSSKLRIAIDARRSNCWSQEPGPVHLASGSLFGDLGVESQEFYVGHIDIVDCFLSVWSTRGATDLFWLAGDRCRFPGIESPWF